MLCAAGADVEARENGGWTPLSYALSSYDCIAVLLAAGAQANAVIPFQEVETTPFMAYRMAIHNVTGSWPCIFVPDQRAYPLFIRAGATFLYSNYFLEGSIKSIQQYVQRVFAAGGFPAYERAHLVRGTKTVESKLGLPARPARLVAEYWLHAGFY